MDSWQNPMRYQTRYLIGHTWEAELKKRASPESHPVDNITIVNDRIFFMLNLKRIEDCLHFSRQADRMAR
jgi:hypothetical protein